MALVSGEVEHGDRMGNKGVILSGDVQWMTAGSGNPSRDAAEIRVNAGLSALVNLPAKRNDRPKIPGNTNPKSPLTRRTVKT